MDYILLTPGPTPLPPSVYEALSRPILHHRTEEFGKQFQYVIEGVQYAARTKNDVLMVTSSGSACMEASVANLLSPGDKTVVLDTGVFGRRFVKIHEAYGLSPVVVPYEWGRAADPAKLAEVLRKEKGVKAVFMQHTDTSTGIVNDLKALAQTVREHSDAAVVVDAVSGLAVEELEADAWDLDVVISASQKGLMAPPGLGFVAVSPRAWKLVETGKLPRFYFDWRAMRDNVPTKQTPYTPAVTIVAAQAEALRLIREEGIENVWKRTAELAAFTREAVAKMGLKIYQKDPGDLLTAVCLPEGVDGKKLIRDILSEEKISIAGGHGELAGKIVRVAHMGYIGKPDVEAGLKALATRLSLTTA